VLALGSLPRPGSSALPAQISRAGSDDVLRPCPLGSSQEGSTTSPAGTLLFPGYAAGRLRRSRGEGERESGVGRAASGGWDAASPGMCMPGHRCILQQALRLPLEPLQCGPRLQNADAASAATSSGDRLRPPYDFSFKRRNFLST
jgi:hypothetical protein